MPTWLAIVLGVFVALVIILAVGGAIARNRQLERTRGRFDDPPGAGQPRTWRRPTPQDRGWARDTLDAAAREALAAERPGRRDRGAHARADRRPPGTDEDKAVFRVEAGDREERLTLGRSDGRWVFERLD